MPTPHDASHEGSAAALEALEHGLDDFEPHPGVESSPNAPLLNDPASLEVDAGLFASVGRGPQQRPSTPVDDPIATIAVKREVSGWAAVALMAFGLVLGATGAAAVFHDNASRIVASWNHLREKRQTRATRPR